MLLRPRRFLQLAPVFAFFSFVSSLLLAAPAFAAEQPPAGGAELREVFIASALGGGSVSVLVVVALLHRSGRITWLKRLSDWMGRTGNLPGWAAMPSFILAISLLAAAFGLYWDISLHLSDGRDPGPLANPSHFFILGGLLGTFCAGVLAMTLPKPGTKPSPFSVRITDRWYAPLGGVLISLAAVFALVGFPLDDLWHRLFGQDVTLWGPTHLLMLSGAALSLIGQCILLTEGTQARAAAAGPQERPERSSLGRAVVKMRKAAACGGLLAGLSIYQGEFDFGIPQFQLLFHPLMLMVAAGVALVAARVWIGRGGALMALVLYLVLRTGLLILVDPVLDRPTPHFPLYLAEALAIEAVGLFMLRNRGGNPIAFGLAAGAAVGTVGLAGEWAWSHVWMVFPWPANLMPEGAIVGFIAAVAASVIGAWMGNSFAIRPSVTGAWRFAAPAGALAIAVLIGYGLHESPPKDVVGQVTTKTVENGQPGRWVTATVQLNTNQFDRDARWTQALSWQGPGFVNADLVRTGPGRFELTKPLPADGQWKTLVRLHKDNYMLAMPLFQPRDDAIPAPENPALASFTRDFQPDREVLQRESTIDGGTLPMVGYMLMLVIALLLTGLMAWGIARVGRPRPTDDGGTGTDGPARTESHKPAAAPAPPTGRPQTI
jgi:hypothetical protein